MHRRKHSLIVLLMLTSWLCVAQEIQSVNDVSIELPGKRVCNWPPPNSDQYNSKVIYIGHTTHYQENADDYQRIDDDSEVDLLNIELQEGKLIESEKQFFEITGKNSEIDWTKEKVLIISENILYKLGKLENTTKFMGIAIAKDNSLIFIGYKNTFHGVCQGIAQLSEWFSSEESFYAVTIPRSIDSTSNYYCYEGPECGDIP